MTTKRRILLSDHALAQIRHRNLDLDVVLAVALLPGQSLPLTGGREIRQDWLPSGAGRWLLRVIVDVGPEVDVIVTAYRTSKVGKYGGLP